MPGFDGTGPRGLGPMTGGGRGFCNPYSPLYGMGYPYSRPYPVMPRYGAIPYGAYGATPYAGAVTPYGGFPSAQAGLNPQLSKDQQLQMLKDQAQMLSQQLEQINERIKEIGK